ncbi:hypothetical protein BDP27DRAFT_1372511 [Rhodocollybia butyracea]|uniref:Uncharacterized protein n=1 Tax=Rhodocollybia butyracea TaxID=206335 RepID=A0A9P5P484_9AGAR|nr:hypothetical protein BDP27DRAFT_1372511 [Rhodocollybia butyracea]
MGTACGDDQRNTSPFADEAAPLVRNGFVAAKRNERRQAYLGVDGNSPVPSPVAPARGWGRLDRARQTSPQPSAAEIARRIRYRIRWFRTEVGRRLELDRRRGRVYWLDTGKGGRGIGLESVWMRRGIGLEREGERSSLGEDNEGGRGLGLGPVWIGEEVETIRLKKMVMNTRGGKGEVDFYKSNEFE